MMHTTKDLLPAINSLYDFGLTAQEMEKLINSLDIFHKELIENTENYELTRMDKIKNTTINSIVSVYRKGNILLENGGREYSYNKENIKIYKLDTDDDESLIEKIKEDKLYYVLNVYDRSSKKLNSNVILFETLRAKDLEQLSLVHFFISGLYRDLPIPYLNLSNSSYSRDNTKGFIVLKTVDKLIKLHKDKFFGLENINEKFSRPDLTLKQLSNLIQKLYPEAHVEHGKLDKDTRKLLTNNSSLRFIFSVLEVHNHRIAVSLYFDSYYSDDTIKTEVAVVPHTDETYNYVDVERLWYQRRRRGYGYEDDYRPFGDIMFIGEEPNLPKDEVLKDYVEKNTGGVSFLDNHTLSLVAKRYLQKQNRLRAEQDAKDRLRTKIQSKLDTLKTPNGKLKINDVVYTHDKITYQDQELVGDGSDWVYSLLRYETSAYNLDNVTFDGIFSSFVNKTRRDEGGYGYRVGKVGNVDFNIESQILTNKLNISSTRWKINGYRVNTNEIHKCIERAICFEDQSDFDYFLKSVSSCSLKMHRYLQLGLDIVVRDHFDNTEVVLKFPLERIKNLNYLVLNDTEYKIRNTEKLLRLERAETIIDVINTLLSGEVVEGVTAEDVKDLIDAGKQAYISALEKSKELLENCEKVLGIQQEHIELKDGNSFTGYRIKGQLRDYVVNAKDERYSVYDADTASYICIVDKTNSAQAGLDRLVNRLFALHNDSRVATQVTTLKRRS